MHDRFLMRSFSAFMVLILLMASTISYAVVVPGSTYGVNIVSPVLKPGFDSTTGNWIDNNLITWAKTAKSELDYGGVQHFCEKKSESDSLQWQLPTADQAESFYKRAVQFNLLKKRGWELGTIWLQSGSNDKFNEVADLSSGILYLDGNSDNPIKVIACIALPQGFDKSGNYFDGKNTWSKTTSKSYTYQEAIKRCADMGGAGEWKLPTFEQLDAVLAQPLQNSEQFRKIMKENGWAFGTALVQSGSATENYKMLYSNENSRIVTCVR